MFLYAFVTNSYLRNLAEDFEYNLRTCSTYIYEVLATILKVYLAVVTPTKTSNDIAITKRPK